MSIILIGVNHKTAPVEIRERLAFDDATCAAGLRTLVDGQVVREGLIVSTCNRVEVLSATANDQIDLGAGRVTQFLDTSGKLPPGFLNDHLYRHTDEDAVRHLFRVASSLDSMVVGEPQVLGQVRHAYSLAVEAGTAGRVLNRLVHHTFHVAKRVRTETGIAATAVSISYMAVELGKKIFASLKDSTVMLIGAGEMAELSAKHLVNAGASRVLIANRTEAAARQLANQIDSAITVPFDQIGDHLHEADLVICSTGAPDYVVTEAQLRKVIRRRRRRPTCLIDISVPRNIDPAVAKVPNVFLFDIDDLEQVITSNIREREHEAERAELIVQSEVMQFQQSLRLMDVGPSIGALREKFQDIARAELARQRKRLGPLTKEQETAVESLLMSTVNKLSHPILNQMRRFYGTNDAEGVPGPNDLFDPEE
ncbi:MAG TPA: glutamyl-tRNA reductase [Pyrinomonadaceae bacterium]|nr:glutamyl-tRNA reductase [Pyrinomonadaceae bacterium]